MSRGDDPPLQNITDVAMPYKNPNPDKFEPPVQIEDIAPAETEMSSDKIPQMELSGNPDIRPLIEGPGKTDVPQSTLVASAVQECTHLMSDEVPKAGCANCSAEAVVDNVSVASDEIISEFSNKLIYLITNGEKHNVFHVQLNIDSIPFLAIIDSGAVFSFMSYDVSKKLGLETFPYTQNATTLGGNQISSIGYSTASFSIGNANFDNVDFKIFPEDLLINKIYLGIDFLRKFNIKLNIKERIISQSVEGGGHIDIYVRQSGDIIKTFFHNVNCYAAQNIDVRSGTSAEVLVNHCIMDSTGEEMLMYSDDYMDDKLSTNVRGLTGIINKNCNKVILVCSEGVNKVRAGQVVGKISSVVQVPESDENCVPDGDIEQVDPIQDITLPHISVEQQTKVLKVLSELKSVFSMSKYDVRCASVTEHGIKLYKDTPIYQRPRRMSPPIAEEIEKQCKELHALDVIEPSVSPWNSPIVPVSLPDGGIRMCLDYRKLNQVTIPDRFPVPNLLDSLFGLSGVMYFTRLDLRKGFYQLPIDESSRPYTAFSTSKNHWQFRRLSMGLRNAPAAFQREIQAVLSSFPSNKLVVYIDDILIMGNSFEEHLSLVRKVLQTLNNYSLKINPSKCKFFVSEVEFLGHIVSRSGISKTPQYVEKIKNYPRPTTRGELREFLGFVNFQRKFVSNCSLMQQPLSCLTGGNKNKKLEWTDKMIESFDALKCHMQNEIELAYPDYSVGAEKLELYVDASNRGAGSYLAQKQNGAHRVIGFASMTFSGTQLNYSTLERELCALRWGVKTFRPFLHGTPFILYTDHQPLVHLHNMKIICSRIARTLEELADYVFEIRYVPGKLNTAADALSRVNNSLIGNNGEEKFEMNGLEVDNSTQLPEGLIIDGPCVPGGGDSMIVSLHRTLSSLSHSKCFLMSVLELREKLVDEVLSNPNRYGIKLNKNGRRALRLMRCSGQLPSFDLLMAASYLFSVQVHIYFWPKSPVIYQYDDMKVDSERVVSIQCISGIHFNPLSPRIRYKPPDVQSCSVSMVITNNVDYFITEERGEDVFAGLDVECNSVIPDLPSFSCGHSTSTLPCVGIKFREGEVYCALLDSAAEISIISHDLLERIKSHLPIEIALGRVCDALGLSGHRETINKSVELTFIVTGQEIQLSPGGINKNAHKFGVVPSHIFPYCMLLGMDFMEKFRVEIDLHACICTVLEMSMPLLQNGGGEVALIYPISTERTSHKLSIGKVGDDLRFVIEGHSSSVSCLELTNDLDSIRCVQTKCSDLHLLCKMISKRIAPYKWPKTLKLYKKHHNNVLIDNDVLYFNKNELVTVMPFEFLVGVALTIHREFAHVGRDKLLALLSTVAWHPSMYRICNDVCTTCHNCQLMKECPITVSPPTYKIHSSYPLELVAMDCINLPATSQGFIGCLVMVDHFTKWVAVVPLRNKKSSSIIHALNVQILPFLPKMPANFLTDSGPEFSSREFSEYIERIGKHKITTPLHPQSNGAVERANRTVKNLIRNLIDEGSFWDKVLPKAVMVYNSTVHSEIGMSPSDFILTKPHELEGSVFPPAVSDVWRMGHPNFCPFTVGDEVLYKVHHKGFLTVNKLSPVFAGPYRVITVNDNGMTYRIEHKETKIVSRAHHTQLRKYRTPPDYILSHPCYLGKDNIVSYPNDFLNNVVNSNVFSGSSYSSGSGSDPLDGSDSDPWFSGFSEADDCISGQPRVPVTQIDTPHNSCPGCTFERAQGPTSSRALSPTQNLCQGEPRPVAVEANFVSDRMLPEDDVLSIDECVVSPRMYNSNNYVLSFDNDHALLAHKEEKIDGEKAVDQLRNLLDWSESDFELYSVCSDDMLDESREKSKSPPVKPLSSTANWVDNKYSLPNDSDEDFVGFTDNDTTSLVRSRKLRELLKSSNDEHELAVVSDSETIGRRLRSHGPVRELPRVQDLILERMVNRERKRLDTA